MKYIQMFDNFKTRSGDQFYTLFKVRKKSNIEKKNLKKVKFKNYKLISTKITENLNIKYRIKPVPTVNV